MYICIVLAVALMIAWLVDAVVRLVSGGPMGESQGNFWEIFLTIITGGRLRWIGRNLDRMVWPGWARWAAFATGAAFVLFVVYGCLT